MYRKNFLISLVFCICFVVENHAQTVQKDEKPPLIIQVVVEQMRYDILERYWNKFSEKGFKRLIKEGTFCRNACYDYINTQSAPGYATLATGSNPCTHGIIADSWYLRLNGREQFCIADPSLKEKPGFPKANHFSPNQLIGSTIGDELRISNYKQSKVISISNKPLGAVLSSGNLGNAAYWIDAETGNWTSSPYYMDSIPRWASDFNKKNFVSIYLDREWNTINPKNTYTESLADNNSYEKGFSNKQRTFPYNLSTIKKSDGYKAINYTPFGNTYTIDFAVSAIINENLGKDAYPDIITIAFATPGCVCDLFGIRSIELEDIYIRLDKDIAHLLEFVEDRFGKNKVLTVLTSDRGAADNPEFMENIGMPAGKFYPSQSLTLLDSYLKALYGINGWVKHYANRQIYLNDIAIDASKTPAGEVQIKAAQFMGQFQAIATATTAHLMQTSDFTSGELPKFKNSYNFQRSGDILLSFKPGWLEIDLSKPGENGVTASPYRYDAHVPLIFYGWKIKPKEITEPISLTDLAPTLAYLLKISNPSSCKGQVIEKLFSD